LRRRRSVHVNALMRDPWRLSEDFLIVPGDLWMPISMA